jgi:endonuclease-3
VIQTVIDTLRERHPDAKYELNFTTPLELLVATILAAQATDERVNRVTPALFAKYKDAAAYRDANTAELEEEIKLTGFYKQKAKTIQGACRVLVENFNGEVPRTMDELTTLPGIARKSANVILNTAWNIPSGIIVDTHVFRVSRRLGISRADKPDKVEEDLMKLVSEDQWTFFGPAMVLFGRYTCVAKKPKCPTCPFDAVCPKNDLDKPAKEEEAAD